MLHQMQAGIHATMVGRTCVNLLLVPVSSQWIENAPLIITVTHMSRLVPETAPMVHSCTYNHAGRLMACHTHTLTTSLDAMEGRCFCSLPKPCSIRGPRSAETRSAAARQQTAACRRRLLGRGAQLLRRSAQPRSLPAPSRHPPASCRSGTCLSGAAAQ